MKTTGGQPFEKDDGSPLHLVLPPQRSLVRSRGRHFSSSLTTIPCPFTLSHGTTTLGFTFQGGVIAAADTRASCAGLVACPVAQKIIPIHSHMVVTTSGSGADCMLWERILAREIRLYQLRHGRRLSVTGAAKLLSFMLHPFKGTEVCVAATLCGWDGGDTRSEWDNMRKEDESAFSPLLESEPSASASRASSELAIDISTSNTETSVTSQQADGISKEVGGTASQDGSDQILAASCRSGPRVCYVCSDGLLLKGELISVGSGSPYAYSILDDGWKWSMSVEEAVALAREAVYRATHRDAYSGNNVDLFHITERGWCRRRREDLKDEYHRERRREKEIVQQQEREKEKRENVQKKKTGN
ncbi:proteasome subunit beta type-11a isoform X2 [Pygocentrus nattereri]|uniref:Proteasome subunit beta n=2 Tax=Pygocentrus nattereri TaxID=42514 RepID=A0A3B4EDI2_PYGNA|nr:proteasome subunit beta type-11a isoform X2 [Pygocentrus nattereri]